MEGVLATRLDEVLVGANTGGFKSLGTQLLVLVGDEVDAERELIDTSTLAAEIEDANLGVGDTAVEARLRVGLVPVELWLVYVSQGCDDQNESRGVS